MLWLMCFVLLCCISCVFNNKIHPKDVIPVLRTERIGAYGSSILMPTAFAPPVSLSGASIHFHAYGPRRPDLDHELPKTPRGSRWVDPYVCKVSSGSALKPFGRLQGTYTHTERKRETETDIHTTSNYYKMKYFRRFFLNFTVCGCKP